VVAPGVQEQKYKLVSAVVRRSRIDRATIDEVATCVQQQKSLADIFFRDEFLDICPDIFPPNFVGAYIERDANYGAKPSDTPEEFFRRKFSNRRLETITQLYRQVLSAAKADATRRTTAVHAVQFRDQPKLSYASLEESYHVFYEALALQSGLLDEPLLSETSDVRKNLEERMQAYEAARGKAVMDNFFALIDSFKELGISQKRDVKQKYPIHGLVYGSAISLPNEVKQQMEQAGQLVFSALQQRLQKPRDAIFFSLDFFLAGDRTYLGADVHEQAIGMGIQHQVGVEGTKEFYDALADVIGQRTTSKTVGISYDDALCRKNRLYNMEIQAMRENLRERGYTVRENSSADFTLRLYGGTVGVPTPEVTALTEDRAAIMGILQDKREELSRIGVSVPRTYGCNAKDLVESAALRDEIADVLETSRVFVHPKREHIFKPFEVDLEYANASNILGMTLQKAGCMEGTSTVLVMERVKNYIPFGGKEYPHEIRTYFLAQS